MMDKRHFSPNKKDRVCKYFHPLYKFGSKSVKEFQRVEDVLDIATCDLINGKSKSEILLKLQNGLYEGMEKGIALSTAEEYYKAILSRLQIDEPDKDNARQIFYSMYLALFNDQVENGNTMGAKQTLDSMVKLMGLDKQNAPSTAIQVNGGDKLEIKFGFDGD